jgi:hypothetical protein
MTDELKEKMNKLMYRLTKHAARNSFMDFLEEEVGITDDDYEEIKKEWEKMGITRTYC